MSGSSMTDPLLRALGVSRSYGGVQALDAADIEIRAGDVHGVIGPNGAGKSTLMKIIAGAERPDEGCIELDGEVVTFQGPYDAQRLGVVLMPQELTLLPGSSLVDNVVLGAEPRQFGIIRRRAAIERSRSALEAVGLDFDPRLFATHLSTAHRRLLTLARAIDRKARLLILDEPTAGLAPREAEIIKDTVRRLKDRGITIVYISHHLSEVAELCDRVTCVREGRVVATVGGSARATIVTKEMLVDLMLAGVSTPLSEAVLGGRVGHGLDITGNGAPQPIDWTSGSEHRAMGGTNEDPDPPGIQGVGLVGSRIDAVSLTAQRNQITGVAGLLGSGVAELIAMFSGTTKPSQGHILIDGRQVLLTSPAAALAEGIGYLAGDRTTVAFREMSVRENVTISALRQWFGLFGLVRPGLEKAAAAKALAAVDVSVDAELPINTLSGGNQQRALVSRVIAADSRVLILNDPTVGVDIGARATLWKTLKDLAVGRTIIVASSEAEELTALCDTVVCLRNGRVVAVLEGDEVTVASITQAIS